MLRMLLIFGTREYYFRWVPLRKMLQPILGVWYKKFSSNFTYMILLCWMNWVEILDAKVLFCRNGTLYWCFAINIGRFVTYVVSCCYISVFNMLLYFMLRFTSFLHVKKIKFVFAFVKNASCTERIVVFRILYFAALTIFLQRVHRAM
jgi:hypothetical protein